MMPEVCYVLLSVSTPWWLPPSKAGPIRSLLTEGISNAVCSKQDIYIYIYIYVYILHIYLASFV